MIVSPGSGPGHVAVEGCVNFRDAGGWTRADGVAMRTGRLFRSDDPIRLTPTGRRTVESMGLSAVIDIRQPAQVARSAGFLGPDRTHLRPLVDRMIDTDNPPRLTEPADMADVYEGMLERSRGQIGEVLDLVAAHLPAGPVLVHCAYGKDRTGIVIGVIHAALGFGAEVIVEDYTRSDEPSRRRFEWIRDHPRPDDTPPDRLPRGLFSAPAAAMEILLERELARYGSLAGWVASFPTSAGTLAALEAALLERQPS